MLNAIDFALSNHFVSRAGALLVVRVPEPGMMPTLAIYMGALGLFLWCCRRASRRSGV